MLDVWIDELDMLYANRSTPRDCSRSIATIARWAGGDLEGARSALGHLRKRNSIWFARGRDIAEFRSKQQANGRVSKQSETQPGPAGLVGRPVRHFPVPLRYLFGWRLVILDWHRNSVSS